MKLTKAPRTLTLLERKAYRNAYRGKVLLDAADPDWPKETEADNLNMQNGLGACGCVLAQWDGDYFRAQRELDIEDIPHGPQHYGFNQWTSVRGKHPLYPHLQRAWTYILRKLGR